MEWYWWLIIGIGLTAIGIAKIIYLPRFFKRYEQKKQETKKRMEE